MIFRCDRCPRNCELRIVENPDDEPTYMMSCPFNEDDAGGADISIWKEGKGERKIEVTYDGRWPNACSGTLTVTVDGVEIYKKRFCCESTGSCCYDPATSECHTFSGKLIWKDAHEHPQDVQDVVAAVLESVEVCCGGCE